MIVQEKCTQGCTIQHDIINSRGSETPREAKLEISLERRNLEKDQMTNMMNDSKVNPLTHSQKSEEQNKVVYSKKTLSVPKKLGIRV